MISKEGNVMTGQTEKLSESPSSVSPSEPTTYALPRRSKLSAERWYPDVEVTYIVDIVLKA
jgi:hypothetical protein